MSDSIAAYYKLGNAIVPAAAALDPQPRGLLCTVAGSVTFEYHDGDTATVVLPVGYHPCHGIRAITAAAGTVHGYYDKPLSAG